MAGTPGAARSVRFLQSTLAKAISAQVFADRVRFAEVAATQTTTSTSFTDLATVGPRVETMDVTFGLAVVTLSAGGTVTAPAGTGGETQYMGVEVSGATSLAAAVKRLIRPAGGQPQRVRHQPHHRRACRHHRRHPPG